MSLTQVSPLNERGFPRYSVRTQLRDSGATGQLTFYTDGRRRSFVVDILALTKNAMVKVRATLTVQPREIVKFTHQVCC